MNAQIRLGSANTLHLHRGLLPSRRGNEQSGLFIHVSTRGPGSRRERARALSSPTKTVCPCVRSWPRAFVSPDVYVSILTISYLDVPTISCRFSRRRLDAKKPSSLDILDYSTTDLTPSSPPFLPPHILIAYLLLSHANCSNQTVKGPSSI